MQYVDIPLQFIDAAVQYSIPSDIQSALNGYKNNQQSLTARQGAFGALYNNQQTRPLAYSFVGNNVGYDDMNKAVTDMFKKVCSQVSLDFPHCLVRTTINKQIMNSKVKIFFRGCYQNLHHNHRLNLYKGRRGCTEYVIQI